MQTKYNATDFLKDMRDLVLAPKEEPVGAPEMDGTEYRTPSQSPFPVFVMAQPMYVDTKVANNIWMQQAKGKGEETEIDLERFMGEWYNFYKLLSANSLVYLVPPPAGLQDMVYVNSFVYLPHVKNKDICILSNFTAEGRPGEENAAGDFLAKLGYECVKSPFKFEGFPELKILRDNIYFGGYGFRSDSKVHDWLESMYGCEIIRLEEKDEHLYHLDCSLFVLGPTDVIVCTELYKKNEIKQIEKVATIHAVTSQDCHENACNNVRVGDMLLSASSLETMKKSDPEFKKEWHKNERLQEICQNLGIELIFMQLEEASKSGAAMSCMCTPLNVRY